LANLLTLPHCLDREAMTVRAIVETPRGQSTKFDYDPESGLFALHGVLPAGMAFPLAFGFVPNTLADDGDPIDILVLADETLPVGCLAPVRLLGVIEACQTERDGTRIRNDRLIGRILASRLYADVSDLDCLGQAMVSELSRFFETYNALKGKHFEVTAISDPARACALIEEATRPAP
jgi:inorganic pyrophosphatase